MGDPTRPEAQWPEPASLETVTLTLLGVVAGAALAVLVLPAWLPDMASSLEGPAPRGYHDLARSSGVVAFALLTLSTLSGLGLSTKGARAWPGAAVAYDLHQHGSLLALAASVFHALILLGDPLVEPDLVALLLPFASPWETVALGMGQLSLWLLALVLLSFHLRPRLGHDAWRRLHYASFLLYALALGHGVASGTDAALLASLYWISGGAVLFLTALRAVVAVVDATSAERPATRGPGGRAA